ncbi:BID domain-containing T4SS effector [Bartonella sp. AR 15-3]|uniref:BID domain-containing T4SS effector n=1 Tax=Bartonella sp. AR 15-3 TaxID=545617 RepID=UPI0001F4B9E3|nr:BID domain-containing T4SS effector [Bartonella sp. AR 15-3]OPB31779.1 Bartonella effector protein Bep1/2 [Bartonella sp. AR 15-3]OPB32451.1 Bartonella effector protein Bep1/1 [Bartonella sp. AR 15-3]CBI78576.1 Bartonella effector protein (Bep); substrate of VirB T4SS [Bartonella sp. AR 15-3]CBI79183.1 Bartonella effector protein (Bep); substrate of VirB T4SS [Bartonella sp. AR 15-3]
MKQTLSNEAIMTESASSLPSPNNYNYPNSLTLKNKYGIINHQEFMDKCAHDSAKAAINLRQEALPKKFDSSYLKYLHKRLFESSFEWAGCTRDIPFPFKDGTLAVMPEMMRSNWKTDKPIVFATGNKVQDGLKNIDRMLIEKDNLQNLPRQEFIHHIAEIFSSLNYTHPFREGNGRTQRLFCEKLAQAANYNLDFSVVTKERMSEVSIAAAQDGNLEPMKKLFDDISDPHKTAILKEFISNIQNIDQEDINDCIIVAADKGVTYTGIYKGASPNSIIIKTENTYTICSKDHLTPEQLKTLNLNNECTLKIPTTQNKENVLIPKEILAPLTSKQILKKIQNNTDIQNKKKEIKHLSKLVYASAKTLNQQIKVINNNQRLSKQLSSQIISSPNSVANLAGFEILGMKSPARKKAEDHAIKLANSIDTYASIIKNVKATIIQQYKSEQKRLQTTVKLPSPTLQNILNLSEEKRKELLSEEKLSSSIARELDEFMHALNTRLSPSERKNIHESDHQQLAKSVGISENKAATIIKVAQEAKEVSQQIQKLAFSVEKQFIVAN